MSSSASQRIDAIHALDQSRIGVILLFVRQCSRAAVVKARALLSVWDNTMNHTLCWPDIFVFEIKTKSRTAENRRQLA